MNLIKRLFVEEEGQGLVEYALILGLIAVAAVVILKTMGGSIESIFENIQEKLGGAVPDGE